MIVEDKIAVRKVIQDYMDCWSTHDVEKFKSIFHPKFLMVGKRGDEFVTSGIDAMLPRVAKSDATWKNYAADITHIAVAGPIASVELEEFGFLDFDVLATSYFQLIKQDLNWKIVAKTFHYHR